MTRHLISAAATTLMLGAGMAHADTVEINLIDMLDNVQDGYCLDISGGQGANADPDNGLQGHTCYSPSGGIFVDQGFDSEQFADGVLYMPEFDVCAEVASTQAGAAVGLAECDGSDAQSFVFAGERYHHISLCARYVPDRGRSHPHRAQRHKSNQGAVT